MEGNRGARQHYALNDEEAHTGNHEQPRAADDFKRRKSGEDERRRDNDRRDYDLDPSNVGAEGEERHADQPGELRQRIEAMEDRASGAELKDVGAAHGEVFLSVATRALTSSRDDSTGR